MHVRDMVFKRRQEYGFHGYRIPVVPRAPRSSSRRGLHAKQVEDSHTCAFELLAAVAGKLLQESESSASSNAEDGKERICIDKDVTEKEQKESQSCKSECHDQECFMDSSYLPKLFSQESDQKSSVQDLTRAHNDVPNISSKVRLDVKVENYDRESAFQRFLNKVDGGSSHEGKSCDIKTKIEVDKQLENVEKYTKDWTVNNNSSCKDPGEYGVNTHLLTNLDNTVQSPSCRDHIYDDSFLKYENGVNLATRDDDENSFWCNESNHKIELLRPTSRIRYQRIRKMLTSKHWKVAPKLKDCELPNKDGGIKPSFCIKKNVHLHERCQYEASVKKRKLSHCSAPVEYHPENSSESVSDSPDKGMIKDDTGSTVNFHCDEGFSSVSFCRGMHQPKDTDVKFSIKSFIVPELYIEVPETSTVGSLKTLVLEAVTAILGGGLHVGVILQGKKVRDDNRTLLQAGISHGRNLDSLGFTLEPSFSKGSRPSKDTQQRLPCDALQEISRSHSSPISESGKISFESSSVSNMSNQVESNNELVPSHGSILTDTIVPDSRALISVPEMIAEPLAVVPMKQRPKRSEFSQRRTRRPFSVSEVEALVEAVEQLGTGRWRDVKIRAFDTADHRTYVDLKDKWKTLVHTATISPQQRRGEPVPQEVLDRVLAAHSYWSQHQSNKHHGKYLVESELKLDVVAA